MLERDFDHEICKCYDECDCPYNFEADEEDCTCVCNCKPEDIKVIYGDNAVTEGYLPFYSVDTLEEVHALVEAALQSGEFAWAQKDYSGRTALYEMTLLQEQTLENLSLAGERLAALHKELS